MTYASTGPGEIKAERPGNSDRQFILSAVIWERFLLSGMNQRELVALAGQYGCAGIEFRPYWHDAARESSGIREDLAEHGLIGIYACNEYLLADSEKAVRRSLAAMAESLRLTERLGAGLLRINVAAGPFSRSLLATGWWQKAVGEIIAFAAEKKIVLALENAPDPDGGDPILIRDILKGFSSPWLKATFDTGNWLPAGWNPAEALECLTGQVAYVHLKDMAGGPEGFLPGHPGTGIVDMPGLLGRLTRSGYRGLYALEFPGGQDPAAAVQAGLRYLSKI